MRNRLKSKGELTGLQTGSTSITARFSDLSATSNLAISSASPTSIILAPGNQPTIPPGRIEGFSAYGVFTDGVLFDITDKVTWASSNGAIATVSNSPGTHGQATGLAPGSTDITASIAGVTSPVQILNVNVASTDYVEERIPFEFEDISATGIMIIPNSDDSFIGLPIGQGFDFTFYGTTYTPDKIFVSTNGLITFNAGSSAYSETTLPNAAIPNNLVAAYWNDWESRVYVQTFGTAPNRRLIIQWYGNNLGVSIPPFLKMQAVLYEGTNIIDIRIDTMVAGGGTSSAIGLENSTGTVGTQHCYRNKSVLNKMAIRYRP